MKGFIKACLIAVLVFVVAGIVLLVVAAAGGVTRASLRLFVDQGRLSYGPLDNQNLVFIQDDVYQISGTDVQELEISVDARNYEIYTSEDQNFYIETNQNPVFIEYEDGKLSIEDEAEPGIFLGFQHYDPVTIYVPAGHLFQEFTLDVDAGSMQVNTPLVTSVFGVDIDAGAVKLNKEIQAELVNIAIDAGNLHGYDTIQAKNQMKVSLDAGDLQLDGVKSLGLLVVECEAGDIKMQGSVLGDINAACDAGTIDLRFDGQGAIYNYQLMADAGTIKIGGHKYSDIGHTIHIDGDVNAPTACLRCDAGSIKVDIY